MLATIRPAFLFCHLAERLVLSTPSVPSSSFTVTASFIRRLYLCRAVDDELRGLQYARSFHRLLRHDSGHLRHRPANPVHQHLAERYQPAVYRVRQRYQQHSCSLNETIDDNLTQTAFALAAIDAVQSAPGDTDIAADKSLASIFGTASPPMAAHARRRDDADVSALFVGFKDAQPF